MSTTDRREDLENLLVQLAPRIHPSTQQREKVERARQDLEHKAEKIIMQFIKDEAERPDPTIVGSVAKDTYLWPCDLDLFLIFDRNVEFKQLEKVGLEIGGHLVEDAKLLYASHPYTRGDFHGFEVDVVPCYHFPEGTDLLSAVDRTPRHTAFVNQTSSYSQKEDMRTFKAFCKGLGVYGAEASIGGLSGYLCELMVLAYGSFFELIAALSEWRPPINLEWSSKTGTWSQHKAVKDSTAFHMTDPTDLQRNVAAAVGPASLSLLILAAKELIGQPRSELFFPKTKKPLSHFKMAEITRRRRSYLVLAEMERPKGLKEVVDPQLLNLRHQLWARLEAAGYGPLALDLTPKEGHLHLVLELERVVLSRTRLHSGPHSWRAEGQNFLGKWTEDQAALGAPHVRGERLVVQCERKAYGIEAFLNQTLPDLRTAEPTRTILKVTPMVHIWAPGQPPTKAPLVSFSKLLDPCLPWYGRYG